MAITINDLIPHINARSKGKTITQASIQSVLSSIDQNAIFSQQQAQYSYQVWDQQSPINGVDAQTVMKDHYIGVNDSAYLIKDTSGNVLYFQPYNGSDITTVAQKHVATLSIQKANVQTIKQAIQSLGLIW